MFISVFLLEKENWAHHGCSPPRATRSRIHPPGVSRDPEWQRPPRDGNPHGLNMLSRLRTQLRISGSGPGFRGRRDQTLHPAPFTRRLLTGPGADHRNLTPPPPRGVGPCPNQSSSTRTRANPSPTPRPPPRTLTRPPARRATHTHPTPCGAAPGSGPCARTHLLVEVQREGGRALHQLPQTLRVLEGRRCCHPATLSSFLQGRRTVLQKRCRGAVLLHATRATQVHSRFSRNNANSARLSTQIPRLSKEQLKLQ